MITHGWVLADRRASAYQLDGDAGTLRTGDVSVRLPPDGMLRLILGPTAATLAATVSAADILAKSGLTRSCTEQSSSSVVLRPNSAACAQRLVTR